MLLKVEGISERIEEDRLRDLFSQVGAVDSVTIIRDIYSGKSRRFGFVEMSTRIEGEEAMRKLNAILLDGSRISVKAPKHQRLLEGEMEFKEWLIDHASEILRRVGVKEGLVLLDYGCGPGRLTIPSARIVGKKGRVFAADVSSSALDHVEREAQKEGLENIETVLCNTDDVTVGLQEASMDAILVYDAMHEMTDREGLLRELYRVLKQKGLLSIFPMHLGTEKMIGIMDQCGLFSLRDRYAPPGHKTASEILNFEKRA